MLIVIKHNTSEVELKNWVITVYVLLTKLKKLVSFVFNEVSLLYCIVWWKTVNIVIIFMIPYIWTQLHRKVKVVLLSRVNLLFLNELMSLFQDDYIKRVK